MQEYDKKSEELDSLKLQKKEYELRLESLQAALTKSRQVSIAVLPAERVKLL